jgi:hypothetical protein
VTGPGTLTESERDGGDSPITIRLRAELPIRRRSPYAATAPAAVDLAEHVVAPLLRALEPPATSGPTTGDWVQGRGAGPWTSFGPPPPSSPRSTGWPEGADSAAGSVTRRLLDDERKAFELVRVQGVTFGPAMKRTCTSTAAGHPTGSRRSSRRCRPAPADPRRSRGPRRTRQARCVAALRERWLSILRLRRERTGGRLRHSSEAFSGLHQ